MNVTSVHLLAPIERQTVEGKCAPRSAPARVFTLAKYFDENTVCLGFRFLYEVRTEHDRDGKGPSKEEDRIWHGVEI